jgi:hypothetical protein
MTVEDLRREELVAFHDRLAAVFVMTLVQAVALGQSASHVIGLPSFCVAGEPLSATETLDYEPAEDSSDPVAVHRDATLYRDSEGRMRTEFKYPDQITGVTIQDCVVHHIYNWRIGDGDRVLSCGSMEGVSYVTDKAAAAEGLDKDSAVIEGVLTHHSRLVKKQGQEIEQIYESWYAPSLYLYLRQVFDRPDTGKTTSRIFNLNMSEPDASLFQVPDEFTSRSGSCPAPRDASESH